jgi:Saxitoxin biosynthesis operon protein SxtJ
VSNALGLEKSSKTSSATDRSFGIMFGCIFIIIAALLRLRDEPQKLQFLLLSFSFITFLVSFTQPRLLSTPNKLWMKFSLLLARFISPIILGVLFYVLISPLALALRLFGRDELRLKTKSLATNWQSRKIDGYSLDSFKNQY